MNALIIYKWYILYNWFRNGKIKYDYGIYEGEIIGYQRQGIGKIKFNDNNIIERR